MKVLIDGENLRHQIAHVLYRHGKIKDNNDFFVFDLAGFFQELLGTTDLQTTYYTTRIKHPKYKIPLQLSQLIDSIMVANRRWIAQLMAQGITVVKAGRLKVRETSACVHCGKRTMILQEKGVDVRVAIDLLGLVGSQERVVLCSSDSDISPALSSAQSKGLKVTYLCYEKRLNKAVAAQADSVVTFTDQQVLKYFGENK